MKSKILLILILTVAIIGSGFFFVYAEIEEPSCNGTIYVNKYYSGEGHGTASEPFHTVTEAYNFACDGAHIVVTSGEYSDTGTFSKRVTMSATGGAVVVGRSSGNPSPGPLGYPPGSSSPVSCSTSSYSAKSPTRCGNIDDAYLSNVVNIGYYPFKIKSGTTAYLYSCDNRVLDVLSEGQGFAAQSVRNSDCSDSPPLRDSENGYVFGYKRSGGQSGWVRADVLEFTGYIETQCADGPGANDGTPADFQVKYNPYDSCKGLVCNSGFNSCEQANDPDDGNDKCGGETRNDTKTVIAQDMYLRYAPGSTAIRYLHYGDVVKVLYDNHEGWVFVEVTSGTCPLLTPNGSRGWCEKNYLN